MMGVRYDYNKKRKVEIGKKICDLYHMRKHTIEVCCESMEVPYYTFYQWVQPNVTEEQIALKQYRRGFVQEVHDYYIRKVNFKEPDFTELAKNKVREGLLKRASGYWDKVVTHKQMFDTNGNPTYVVGHTRERFILPCPQALMFISKSLEKYSY